MVSSTTTRAPSGLTLRVDTVDVDDARDQVARSYCPHVLTPLDGRFHARHAEAGGTELGVFCLSYGPGRVRVSPVPFADFVLISRPIEGALDVGTGSRTIRATAQEPVILDADSEHELRFVGGCRLLTVKIPRASLARAGALAGHRGRLSTGKPLDRRPWDVITQVLLRDAVPHGLLGSPLGPSLAQLAATAAWESFNESPSRRQGATPLDAVDRARAFIDDNADQPIGLLDIAAAAGVSPRTLQLRFREQLGVSPTRHLRQVRLQLVRSDLLAHRGKSVGEIAWRWGFGNLGRFAAEYRRTYGNLPSVDFGR